MILGLSSADGGMTVGLWRPSSLDGRLPPWYRPLVLRIQQTTGWRDSAEDQCPVSGWYSTFYLVTTATKWLRVQLSHRGVGGEVITKQGREWGRKGITVSGRRGEGEGGWESVSPQWRSPEWWLVKTAVLWTFSTCGEIELLTVSVHQHTEGIRLVLFFQ